MRLFSTLGDILLQIDREGHPVPLVMIGVTDARHFSKLGIQTYGFTPMKLSADLKFADLAHAANERIPVEALEFGTSAIQEVMKRFGEIN
jgi:acetylornithine deacetylase/succinyl-diaminopimelate desuccinylase-like protein